MSADAVQAKTAQYVHGSINKKKRKELIMKQEDKEILLMYLSMALPYGVIVTTTNLAVEIGVMSGISIKNKISVETKHANIVFNCTEVRPYLRKMSSMTENEKREYASFIAEQKPFDSDFSAYPKEYKLINEFDVTNYIKWLISHHFDYLGLIEKGLALAVTKENNPYNITEE